MSVPFRNTKITISDADFYFKEILIKNLIPPFDTVVKNCNNGYELIHQLHRKIEDVFFIDLFTPIMSGLEAIRYIRHIGNTTPIIAYSATYQEDIAKILSEIPSVFYCQKKVAILIDIYRNYLLNPIKKYEDYLQEWAQQPVEVIAYMQRQEENAYIPSLVEIQIMKLTYNGLNNREIGESLNLSTRTIDTYIARLSKKIGARNKVDIVRFYVQHGYYNSSD